MRLCGISPSLANSAASALQQLYNAREGRSVEADTLPDRFFIDAVDAGRLRGARLDRDTFAHGLRLVRQLLGWSNVTGAPAATTLARLGLTTALSEVKHIASLL